VNDASPKNGEQPAGNASFDAQNLPADYSEWISQKVCEIGLPNSENATQTVFPFARVLAYRTNRAKRAQFEGSRRRASLLSRAAAWLVKLERV